MCKDNCITTNCWAWISVYIFVFFVGGGWIASSLGAHLTWGEIIAVPFITQLFLGRQSRYFFMYSEFTVQNLFYKRKVSVEKIKQIDVFETKSGTWIVIELYGAPSIAFNAGRKEIFSYYLRNHRKCFLIQLKWGERDKALALFKKYLPQTNLIIF